MPDAARDAGDQGGGGGRERGGRTSSSGPLRSLTCGSSISRLAHRGLVDWDLRRPARRTATPPCRISAPGVHAGARRGTSTSAATFPPACRSTRSPIRSSLAQRKARNSIPRSARSLSQLGRPGRRDRPDRLLQRRALRPAQREEQWPKSENETGWTRFVRPRAPRHKIELVESMQRDLDSAVVGVDWNFSQSIRDNVAETLSGVKGELRQDLRAGPARAGAAGRRDGGRPARRSGGIESVGVFSIMGQTNLEFSIDRDKCGKWNVSITDVQNAWRRRSAARRSRRWSKEKNVRASRPLARAAPRG